jgi:predicted alpha-1,2-mannosidase
VRAFWSKLIVFAVALFLVLCSGQVAFAAPDVVAFVRPFAGTQSGGTFPGAALPFGMVQYSPNTVQPGGGGYSYAHPRTWGFGATHLSGPGCPAMGEAVSMPTTGPVKSVEVTRQLATFSHASEQASPGYYAVNLSPSGVHAELTATTRTGWARLTYPPTRRANVIVDPGAGFRGVRAAQVRIAGSNTVEGSVQAWGYWNSCAVRGPNLYTVHFLMKFDRPFTAFGVGRGSRIRPGRRFARGADAGAYVTFDTAADPRPIVAKVGISFVDAAGARRNLLAETGGGYDFDAVRAKASEAWNSLLGRVTVAGGAEQQIETFYTALYHALLHPSVFSDADGRYTGFDDRIHRATGAQTHYTAFSLWDTYRSQQQVIDLLAPERVADMVRSLLDDQHRAGWLPKWVYGHFYSNALIGDPAANVIADAYLKGLLHGEDARRAYAAALHNATDMPLDSPIEGRTGLDDYINRGFVTYRAPGDQMFAGSLNLEYALNDCALALMARRLDRVADWRYLLRRAKRYRSTIDASAGFARARGADGAFLTPFRARSRHGFKEGSAWQYTWLAPQDVGGLAAKLGGQAAALEKLDRFFAYGQVAADASRARALWRGTARYSPRNEQDLQAPYLYDYLGQPWKTQAAVRGAERLYTTAPNGLPGSDDLGALSGWYVLSALGIYPVTAGDDHYALTTPLFDHVELSLERGYYPGGPIVIDAPGASVGQRYLRAAILDGAPLLTSQIPHAALTRGAHLAFALGSNPDPTWATGARTPRSACGNGAPTSDVRMGLREIRARRRVAVVRATVRNAGNAPAANIRVSLRLRPGWTARSRSRVIRRLAPHQAVRQTWALRATGRKHSTRLRAYARWSAPGVSGDGALRTLARAIVRLPRR